MTNSFKIEVGRKDLNEDVSERSSWNLLFMFTLFYRLKNKTEVFWVPLFSSENR